MPNLTVKIEAQTAPTLDLKAPPVLPPLKPLITAEELRFQNFVDIVTALKAGTRIPMTERINSLIKSEEHLFLLTSINPTFVKIILNRDTQTHHLVTFNFLLAIAKNKSPLVNELAYLPCCVKCINDSSQFLKIAAVNLPMAITLLNYKNIAGLAHDVLSLIPFEMELERYQFNHPAIKERQLKKLKSLNLHIAEPLREEQSPHTLESKREGSLSQKRRMDMPVNLSTRRQQFLASTFPTIANYTDEMMFGESGYYSKGTVSFSAGTSSNSGDFTTFPSHQTVAPAFAAAFAHQLFSIRNNMIAKGQLSYRDRFNVLECGAGNGDLCYHILNIIKKMAAINPSWNDFNEHVRYHIIERSPKLVERQRERNNIFGDKFVIINEDARHLQRALEKTTDSKQMAAVISNELIDVFPPDKVLRADNGSFDVGYVMPFTTRESLLALHNISAEDLRIYCTMDSKIIRSLHPKHEAIAACEKYLIKSNQYKILMGSISNHINHKLIILSSSDFYTLHKIATEQLARSSTPKSTDHTHFKFEEFQIGSQHVPTVDNYIKRNEIYFEKMPVRSARYISLGMESYLKNVSDVLLPGGEVITVDYGNIDDLTSNRLRTYKDRQIGFDIFKCPGYIDITLDVPFTTFIRHGKSLGLQPVFFGQQQQLLPADSSCIPETVVPASVRDQFIAMSEKNTFQACVQRKESKGESKSEPSLYATGRFFGAPRLVTDTELFTAHKAELKDIRYYVEGRSLVNSCMKKDDDLISQLIMGYLK